MRHVDYLDPPELGGRLTGTEGERRATAYVAAYLESLGLEPAGRERIVFSVVRLPCRIKVDRRERDDCRR